MKTSSPLLSSNITRDITREGKTIDEKREEARAKLAPLLLTIASLIIAGTIFIGAILLWQLPPEKFSFKDMLNLILGVSSIFSGLLGATITFYFSSK